MIDLIKPVYSIAFKQWSSNNDNCYYSQMKMIRFLVDKALTKRNYDYYIRIRPDCIITESIKFNNFVLLPKYFIKNLLFLCLCHYIYCSYCSLH